MRLVLTLPGAVPAKANRYRIVRSRSGQPTIVRDSAVRDFEERLSQAAARAMQPHVVTWEMRGRRPRPVNPLYPRSTAVDVSITYHHPSRRHPDTDNLAKAVGDALTRAGVWDDDSQVRDWRLRRRPTREAEPWLVVEVVAVEEPGGSTDGSSPASHRLSWPSPLSRREWLEQRELEPELPRQVVVYCDRCCLAVGQHCLSEEVWLLLVSPTGSKGWRSQLLCGLCADELDLDFRWRILDRRNLHSLRRFQAVGLVERRRRELLAEARRAAAEHSRAAAPRAPREPRPEPPVAD